MSATGKSQIILSVNAGSSSVKLSVYSALLREMPDCIAEASVSGLTTPSAKLSYTCQSTRIEDKALSGVSSPEDAFHTLLSTLESDSSLHELYSKDQINCVCHRVVHGGEYREHRVITAETYHHIEELTDLAPLHNAGALSIVKASIKLLPKAKNIAQFDSSFHQTIPPAQRSYMIDREIADKNHLRKYGFHGISYSFITRSVAQKLKKKEQDLNIIALHLGSGASACAIRNGQSLDTSMGLTPLDGLPGATRSGAIDPSLVFHLSSRKTEDLHVRDAEEILNKKSGWKSLTGTADFRSISTSDDPEFKLAFDIFVDRIVGFIGSYYVKLQGRVDALVFAGGIGERSEPLRGAIADKVKCLGFEVMDQPTQMTTDIVTDISKCASGKRVLICQTDEQLEMVRSYVMDETLFNQ